MNNIFNLDYKDYKNTSQYLENYYYLNNMSDIEKQFLLTQSLETGNIFIFNLINDLNDKDIYFDILYDSLNKLNKSLYLKIKITSNNDKDILEKYVFFTNKFNNIKLYNWEELEKYFYILMYYNEIIEKLQTIETTII